MVPKGGTPACGTVVVRHGGVGLALATGSILAPMTGRALAKGFGVRTAGRGARAVCGEGGAASGDGGSTRRKAWSVGGETGAGCVMVGWYSGQEGEGVAPIARSWTPTSRGLWAPQSASSVGLWGDRERLRPELGEAAADEGPARDRAWNTAGKEGPGSPVSGTPMGSSVVGLAGGGATGGVAARAAEAVPGAGSAGPAEAVPCGWWCGAVAAGEGCPWAGMGLTQLWGPWNRRR